MSILISIILGIVAPIVFMLTENMRYRMVWIDNWTLLMAIISVVQIVCCAVSFRKKKKDEEEGDVQGVRGAKGF